MVAALICFGCQNEVELAPVQLPSGQWVASCGHCGVTNKLRPHPEQPNQFLITGAFVTVQPKELRARPDPSKDILHWPDGTWCFRKDYLKRVVRPEQHRLITHLSEEWERFFGLERNT